MLISVVITSYNVQDYLGECIRSVLNQSYRDVEIICVDDASTDDSRKVFENFCSKYSGRFKILVNEANKGAPYSRNRGLYEADGEYIQFLDADDLLLPDKIKTQVELILTAAQKPDLIVTSYKRKFKNGTLIKKKANHSAWEGLVRTELGITSSNLWNKKFLEKINGWEENLKSSQEYELMFRCLKNGGMVIFDDSFNTIVRERESGSISQKNLPERWDTYIQLRIEIWNYLKSAGVLSDDLSGTIKQVIFDSCRILYRYDKNKALQYYRQYVWKQYQPHASPSTSMLYILVYYLLGFEMTQNLVSWSR